LLQLIRGILPRDLDAREALFNVYPKQSTRPTPFKPPLALHTPADLKGFLNLSGLGKAVPISISNQPPVNSNAMTQNNHKPLPARTPDRQQEVFLPSKWSEARPRRRRTNLAGPAMASNSSRNAMKRKSLIPRGWCGDEEAC
jgi:hypothetical protein